MKRENHGIVSGSTRQTRAWLLACLGAITALSSTTALSQAFPAKPVRLICPFAPGGGNDILSRALAAPMSRSMGQQVIVDNQPGANTIIGLDLVAKAPADGYTMAMASSSFAINATLYEKLPYDPLRDFSAVSMVALTPYIVAVHPDLPAKNVRELIALARAQPGKLSYPSAGIGNPTHLSVALFASMAGVDMLHVPYKGSGPGIVDLVAGRHALTINTALSVANFVKSGKLRAIAISSNTRAAAMPDLPTVTESGLPGYESSSWYGILAPANTPRPVLAKLQAEIASAINTPDMKKLLATQDLTPVGNTPEQFGAIMQGDIAKWAKIIKATGAKAE